MSNPYHYTLDQPPVKEVLDRQTDEQLGKNYAQTSGHVYELSDEQLQEIRAITCGTGSVFTGDWVEARPLTINGERLMSTVEKGTHVKLIPPYI